MKIKLIRSYRKKGTGNVVFVYGVSGSKEQLEAYKKAQGDNYVEAEDGTPLWFTTRCVGQSGNLIITSAGKVIADMSAFEQAASLASQYGGNLGEELAKQAAASLLGTGAVSTPAPVKEGSISNL
jgi:hypothetical protein